MHAKRIRPSYLQDVGKGREQERKLEGSPSGNYDTNCIFGENVKFLAGYCIQPDEQHTRAISGLGPREYRFIRMNLVQAA